ERFYSIDGELREALFRSDTAEVSRLANEYLQIADLERKDWNYGNAIHEANSALGVIAMREGNIKLAEQYLLKAGASPGSPQLDTFGPNLELANSLLKIGSKAAVIEYLKAVSKFWKAGAKALPTLLERINRGDPVHLNRYKICCPNG
ncbi:MAG: hypothetical protein K0Q68_155, partial [Moraxellaceae bacterium]|nr:hypothetical protein [Moraxellaceae bacterium]